MTAIEYTIYEQPQPPDDTPPGLDNPILENPTPDNPILENPMQLNKDIQKTDLPTKEKINTDLQSTHSIPILSPNAMPTVVDGDLQTSKTDKTLHGWGLKSVRTAAEHYDGTIETEYSNHIFRAVVTLSFEAIKA